MDVGTDQVIQTVQNPINYLDEQMTLLVFQRRTHEKGQNLVEKRSSAERPGLVGDLPHGRLALRRRTGLDLEQERHDEPLVALVLGQGIVLDVLHELAEVLHIVRLDVREGTGPGALGRGRGDGDAVRLPDFLDAAPLLLFGGDRHLESRRCHPHGRRGCQKLPAGRPEGLVAGRRGQNGISLLGKDGFEGGIRPRSVANLHLLLEFEGLGQIGR
mmetsp:Transcript_8644/g.24274  ORF Transcript_8644/g.24274 Transcript_8644/m.24274 type:complete len:215 (-) Transcript_8644:1326-1970(-)